VSRKDRVRNIAELDQRLTTHNQRLMKSQASAQAQLQTLSPMLLIGAGLAAGALVHRIGWRSAYSLLPLVSSLLSDSVEQGPPYSD
tara:strand:+ start:6439 stop:6696 length:258 start_codon:yes stop_codon:yes gene_type:complete